jgi:hypothetical protein
MKSIKRTLSVLYSLSAVAILGDGIGLVRQMTLMGVFHLSHIAP